MQYLPVVHMLESKANLSEPVEHMVFRPILKLAASLVSDLVLLLDLALEVATVSEVHHDA